MDTGSVKYQEYFEADETFDSHSIQIGRTSGSATVSIQCRWEDRFAIAQDILEGGLGHTGRQYPFAGDIPGALGNGSKWYAESVSISPMPTQYKRTGQAIEYEKAVIQITYAQMQTEVSFESTGQFVTVNPIGLYWDLPNADERQIAPEEAPGVFIASHDITLTHPHLQISGHTNGVTWNICDFEGACNESACTITFNGVTRTYPAETLLCSSPSLRVGCTLSGAGFFQVSLKISYNPIGHNQWIHPRQTASEDSGMGFVKMFKDKDCTQQVKPVRTMDFSPLLTAFGL